MPISFEKAFSVHEDALLLRGRRSSILASNIANGDTPNYKARDIDFNALLKAAGQKQGSGMTMVSTHRNHMPVQPARMTTEPMYRNPLHPSLDGNTVDSHVEQGKFSENALIYQTSFTLLNGKIQGLMKALKGE